MAKSCLGTILTIAAILAIIPIIFIFGTTPLGITLAIVVGVGVCFLDYWIFYGTRTIQRKRQKVVMCPRCKVLVEIESGICPKCHEQV